jgi:4-amino-4-deoxy-L-arabinose transferase-like glycosyltransferase
MRTLRREDPLTADRPNADPLRRRLAAAILLAAVALALRLPALRAMPVFNDEAIFARWARIASADSGDPLVSFRSAGKQALYIWVAAPLARAFSDPVRATRLTSVLLGLLTLAATARLMTVLRPGESRRGAPLAALLYAVSPFAVLHERLGLYEALVTALGTFAMALAIEATDAPTRRRTATLGVVLGLALVTKEYCAFFLAYPALAVLDRAATRRERPGRPRLVAATAGCALAGAVWLAANAVPRLRGLAPLAVANYFVPPGEMVRQFVANLRRVAEIHAAYTGAPLVLLFAGGCASSLARRRPGSLALPIAVLFATALQAVLARDLYARYLLFTLPLIAVVAASALVDLADAAGRLRPFVVAAGIAAALATSLPADLAILRDPRTAPLDSADRRQFVTGWTSGYGTDEAIAYVRRAADRAGARGIDLFFLPVDGVPLDAFSLAFDGDPRVRAHLAPWALARPLLFFAAEEKTLSGVIADAHRHTRETIDPRALGDVYFVADPPMIDLSAFLARNGDPLSVAAFKKPGGESAIVVLEMAVPGRRP